jgi:hypothetical protein
VASRLYPRTATLLIDKLAIAGLRVVFKVEKTLKLEPNNSEIQVFNVSPTSRAQMPAEGATIQLQAGHEGNEAVIYSGQAHFIDHVFDGPDCVTKIECSDGAVAMQTPVAQSFAPGTTTGGVVERLSQTIGVGVGNLNQKLPGLNQQYSQGHVAKGRAVRELKVVLARAGMTFSIQDGQLLILKGRETTQTTVYKLNSETGLIGSPQHGTPPKKPEDPHLLKVKSILLPQVLPGRLIELDAINKKGLFRVEKLTHKGDTHGDDWFSEMEVSAV